MKREWIFAIFLVLLILISGCNSLKGLKGKKDVKKSLEEIRTGTEGIVMSFLPNAPPDKIHVEKDTSEGNTFDVVLEIRNKGAFPQPEDIANLPTFGKIFLSGYDSKIIKFETKKDKTGDLSATTLEGKSTLNPFGGQDLISFTGNVDVTNLNVEKYEPTLLATACYYYETVAGPTVCIDPSPYATTKEKKVCQVQPITLSNQGAPIAVTKIDEEAFAKKTQFKITIKNVGGGDVMTSYAAFNFCNPLGEQQSINQKKITREDIDKVRLNSVRIANEPLKCGPFVDGETKATSGYIRLNNGEGSIICEMPSSLYSNALTAYTSPLLIMLTYGYRNTIEKKIQIKKEMSGIGEAASDTTPTTTETPPENRPGGIGTAISKTPN